MAENILNNLCTAVISLDHELKVCFINQSAESLLEISASKSLDTPLAELVWGFDQYISIFYDAIQSGQPYTQRMAEFTLTPGTHLTLDFTISPISEGEWPRLLLEMHPLDRYLRIDRDAALNERQEISRQMIRGLAHEVKNPLGGLRGAAQLLARQLPTADLKAYTKVIIDEADRLASLVDSILDAGRQSKEEVFNLHEVTEHVAKLIEAERLEGVQLQRDYDPSLPLTKADRDQLIQAFLNIAKNGLQAIGTKGLLTFRTRAFNNYTLGGERHRLVLCAEVEDNGPGIPDELRETIFYPLVTGHSTGTGIGLTIAQDLVSRNGGLIEFQSNPGSTKFQMFLPAISNEHRPS